MTQETGTSLSLLIRPPDSYLRAANLERHDEQAAHYIPTGRALEVLRRVFHAIDNPSTGRTWSLTGPYGSGKSSFALFLRTLFGPTSARRRRAEAALGAADAGLLHSLKSVRTPATNKAGFVLATTTCQQEPLASALLRSLERGVTGYWAESVPQDIRRAMRIAASCRDSRSIATAAETIAAHAPLLLVLDEFGKTLEHFAAQATGPDVEDSDLFVLQELAERASGGNAAPIFLFTLQHLAFDDYVRRASAAQRREWGKVQGRFEDIPFLETSEQSLRLVAGALDDAATSAEFRERKNAWSVRVQNRIEELGLSSHLPGGADTLARCYPLHPIALLALPELCARLGQHGRTLFSFLAGTEASTVNAFLHATHLPASTSARLPAIQLHYLFDFFAGPGQALAAGIGGSRWREIDERVREAQSLTPEDVQCLKTVGLLNLLGHAGGLRASADQVAYSLGSAEDAPDGVWRERLGDLESRGWLTYRAFADEFRLWQGSDVDLRGKVADAREQLRSTSAAELLARLQDASPVIAAKHSQRVGMLRYFAVGFADASTPIPEMTASDPADGALVYFLDDPTRIEEISSTDQERPLVLATSDAVGAVRDAAVEVAAALAVLDQQEVIDDRVARRELQDRVSDARARLTAAQAHAFRPRGDGVAFHLVQDGRLKPLVAEASLSRLLSTVCDDVYRQSPEIRNEMLGRRELTSQGAKARRELLGQMLSHGHLESLGMAHFGPNRAMYEAVLRHTGLHREIDGQWTFGAPMPVGSMSPLWGTMAQIINPAVNSAVGVDQLYAQLMAPPLGIKEGPIPVLLAAFLLQRRDDVAIYEDGTFQPSLTADLLERLVKSPKRFALKAFNATGVRGKALTALSDLGQEFAPHQAKVSPSRNGSVLRAAAPLLTFVRKLPEYTLNTTSVSVEARAIREALVSAREPDVLLFEALPAAAGLPALASRGRGGDEAAIALTCSVRSALNELRDAYPRRLRSIAEALAAELKLNQDLQVLRTTLAQRAEPLEDKVLDPKLRTFLFICRDEAAEDDAWCEAMGLCVSDRPPVSWRDADVDRFSVAVRGVVASFQRVQALHFEATARGTTDGFSVRRLTQTSANGREVSRVMYVSLNSRPDVDRIADKAMADVIDLLGPQGAEALLEVLAERVLSEPEVEGVFNAESPTTRRARRHG